MVMLNEKMELNDARKVMTKEGTTHEEKPPIVTESLERRRSLSSSSGEASSPSPTSLSWAEVAGSTLPQNAKTTRKGMSLVDDPSSAKDTVLPLSSMSKDRKGVGAASEAPLPPPPKSEQPISTYQSLEGRLQKERSSSCAGSHGSCQETTQVASAPTASKTTQPTGDETSGGKVTTNTPSKVTTTKTVRSRSSSTSSGSSKSKSKTTLRRGKWTAEEEAYVARVIKDFNSGYLDAPPATTLRTYLSEKLKCDPMRITKKVSISSAFSGGLDVLQCSGLTFVLSPYHNEVHW
jgi:hypothetical protein